MIATAGVLADSGWHGHWWIWVPFFWTARTILAERYARGEISADDYRERLETLA